MKLKQKLILDGVLLALLIVLMDYSLTGGVLHELLGIVLLAGFIVHIAVNREYYKAIIRGIRSGKVSAKSKAGFAVDIILPISAVIMLISSLAISRDLFPGIAELFGGQFWVPVHIICAVVLLISVFIHVCMHAKLISAFIGQVTDNEAVLKMKTAGMRVMALLFALLVVRSSFSSMADAANMLPACDAGETEIDKGGNRQNNELIVEEDNSSDQDGYVIGIEPDPEPEETVSLDDYLGSLFCSGCGKHCSLLSPRCGKGEDQASQATAEYYEIYSEQSV
jgi:hypothetical protein